MNTLVKCPFCGPLPRIHRSVRLLKCLHRQNARIDFCISCGLGITNPAPKLSEIYYQQTAFFPGCAASKRLLAQYEKISQSLISYYGKVSNVLLDQNVRIIDIGAGSGLLGKIIKRDFPNSDYFPIEPSAANQKYLLSLGIKPYATLSELVSDYPGLQGKIDIIIYSSVLEHISDPVAEILSSKRLLGDRGMIFISQADPSGLLPAILPQLWYAWQPIEHFYHFNLQSLRRLAGLTDMKCNLISRLSLHQDVFSRSAIKLLPQLFIYALSMLSSKVGRGDLINVAFRLG
jgi:hypothetical protein